MSNSCSSHGEASSVGKTHPLVAWKPDLFVLNMISFVTQSDYQRQKFLSYVILHHITERLLEQILLFWTPV